MKVGFTAGAFDLCHAGHFLMFKECKEVCDHLVVGLQSNPAVDRPTKNRPIMGLEERRIVLEGIKYIDEIIIYHTEKDLYGLLKNLHAKYGKKLVRILGEDWEGKPFTGYDLPIKSYFNKRRHNYSTTDLRKRIYEDEKLRE